MQEAHVYIGGLNIPPLAKKADAETVMERMLEAGEPVFAFGISRISNQDRNWFATRNDPSLTEADRKKSVKLKKAAAGVDQTGKIAEGYFWFPDDDQYAQPYIAYLE